MIMSVVRITITVPEIILEDIDENRGLIPRSAFISNILEKAKQKKSKGVNN